MSDFFPLPNMLDQYVRAVSRGEATHSHSLQHKGTRSESLFHFSDTLKCHRARILKRIGAPKTENNAISMRRFILGDAVESIVEQAISWCIANAPEYKDFKCEYHRHVSLPEYDVDGTLDFLLTFPDKSVSLWDTKSCLQMKIDYVKKGEKDRVHYGQLTGYRMALAREGQRVDRADVVYVEKGTMVTHPDRVPDGFEATVAEDYGRLVNAWKHYQKTRIVPPEMPFVPGQQKKRRDGSLYWKNGGDGGTTMPNVFTTDPENGTVGSCDPRYCQLYQNCKKVKHWWENTGGYDPEGEE
ncbi:MAG TPA: hypothetical protein VN653_10945 [Anaerolineales bacterium]|nr:hypothetical protein [Anaerolineales bacterium]